MILAFLLGCLCTHTLVTTLSWFWLFICHKTCLLARMCLLGVALILFPIGVKLPQNNFGGRIKAFSLFKLTFWQWIGRQWSNFNYITWRWFSYIAYKLGKPRIPEITTTEWSKFAKTPMWRQSRQSSFLKFDRCHHPLSFNKITKYVSLDHGTLYIR